MYDIQILMMSSISECKAAAEMNRQPNAMRAPVSRSRQRECPHRPDLVSVILTIL